MFDEARAIRDGGGFGSIIGRNCFQRPKEHALKFLETIMGIYAGEIADNKWLVESAQAAGIARTCFRFKPRAIAGSNRGMRRKLARIGEPVTIPEPLL